MDKVYVRFGDFSKNNEFVSCFEAVVENHIVRIILPTTLYSTCQLVARQMDLPAFLIVGDLSGKSKDGEPILTNIKFKVPLKFDKELENYITDFNIPRKSNRTGIKLPKWFKE